MRELSSLALAALSALALTPLAAAGAAYPEKPVRLIVPFPPGGGNDMMARTVGQKLGAALGQQFVIDNRPGAGGAVGAEAAAKAAPDGYTLFLGGVGSHGINPNLHSKLGYDPIRDFAPVSLIASVPLLLVVHPSLPVKSVKELIALARTRPGQLNFASLGEGSSSHLATELFMMMSGTRMVHIPYNKSSPVVPLVAGEVQLMFSSALRMLPQVRAGKLRAVATTGARRSPTMPGIPTVAESGVPGYETASWYGILAPAGTPPPVVTTLGGEIANIVRMADIRARLATEAADPIGSSPEQFATHIRNELARWAKVVKQSGIRVD